MEGVSRSFWSPINFDTHLPSPPISFIDKVSEFALIIGNNMHLIGQAIGAIRSYADWDYLQEGELMDEATPFGKVGNLILCFSDFGSIFPFLSYWGVDFSKVTGAIGQVRFLAPLMQVPIASVLSFLSVIGYTYFGIDAAIRLSEPETVGPHRRQAYLDIANAVCQVALSGLLVLGATKLALLVPGITKLSVLIPIGGVCMVVGSVCFIHRCYIPPGRVTKKKKAALATVEAREGREKIRVRPATTVLRNSRKTNIDAEHRIGGFPHGS